MRHYYNYISNIMKYLKSDLKLFFIETKEYIQEITLKNPMYTIKLIKIQVLLKYIFYLDIYINFIIRTRDFLN